MKQKLLQTLSDERGMTMIEYGLITAIMGGVILGGVTVIGGDISAAFADGLSPTLAAQLEQLEARLN